MWVFLQTARSAISDEQLDTLQARIHALHAARLLEDDAVFCVEDCIVDCIEAMPTAVATDRVVEKVIRMVAVSERVLVDATFARQVKRKFL
jgi:hypothetical protein